MRSPSPILTPQELAIMKAVWPSGRATVREVYEQLRPRREIAYTTVQTMMNLLEGKGYLRKIPGTRPYRYAPTRPRARVLATMVKEFVARVFDGSPRPLLVHLLEDEALSEDERRALRRLLDKGEK